MRCVGSVRGNRWWRVAVSGSREVLRGRVELGLCVGLFVALRVVGGFGGGVGARVRRFLFGADAASGAGRVCFGGVG